MLYDSDLASEIDRLKQSVESVKSGYQLQSIGKFCRSGHYFFNLCGFGKRADLIDHGECDLRRECRKRTLNMPLGSSHTTSCWYLLSQLDSGFPSMQVI